MPAPCGLPETLKAVEEPLWVLEGYGRGTRALPGTVEAVEVAAAALFCLFCSCLPQSLGGVV